MGTDFSIVLAEEDREALVKPQRFNLEEAKKTFRAWVDQVANLLEKAIDLKVENDQQNEIAVSMGTTAKQLYKKVEAQKNELIKEPEEYVKGIRSFAKIFTEKLLQIESTLKQKITSYRVIQEQKRREASLEAKKETDRLQAKLTEEAAEKGIEAPKILDPILPKEAPVIRTETGSASGRKTWTFELIDLSKVPEEYKILDEKKVRDAVRAGIRQIEGIRIYERETTTFRL